MSFSVANFKDVREQSKTFESFVAFNGANFALTGDGEAERVNGRNVSSGIFQTLKVQPILGRAFRPEEDKPGAERVVMLGEGCTLHLMTLPLPSNTPTLICSASSQSLTGVASRSPST